MSSQDLVHNVKAQPGYAGATISSSTDTDSAIIIDTQGFESSMFAVYSGTLTDGSYLLKIMESDNADGSSATEVASYQQQDTLTASNSVNKVGARANKRYQKLRITSSGVTSGCVFKGAINLLDGAKNAPVA